MPSKELEDTINALHLDANHRRFELITVEHLLLVLLQENRTAIKMLKECQADIEHLKIKLSEVVEKQTATRHTNQPVRTSIEYRDVLQRAKKQFRRLGEHKSNLSINGIHIIIAILDDPRSAASHYLKKYGVDRLYTLAYLASLSEESINEEKPKEKDGKDLVAQARAKTLPLPINRQDDIAELINILCRKYKNNPLLVGEPGVGKTTLVEALAHRIANDDVPAMLQNTRIISISIADIIAGTKYRGDLEQRIKKIIEKYSVQKNNILFIDEIHTLIGTGSAAGGTLDIANIIKPFLDNPALRYIGATTSTEYRRYFEKDGALNRRFCKITVGEPDAKTLQAIVENTVHQLQLHYQINYPTDAVTTTIDAAKRYLPAYTFPDKAIDILDHVGSNHINNNHSQPIDKQLIISTARSIAGLTSHAQLDDYNNLADMENHLCNVVFDQKEAAKKLARAVVFNQIGYSYNDKVVGGFLFVGPTGVGKTEMAKQLAEKLSFPLLRYDMSEYMERHSISRLIGAPPGYVGYEQSGKLIENVSNNPNSVILFDEIEKAHPDILNILLQILDYGTMADNNGRLVNFRHTIIILTSNSGSVEMARGSSGFDRNDTIAIGDEVIHRNFSPEFRNRLDAIIHFQPLSPATIQKIIEQQLTIAKASIKQHQSINTTYSQRFKDALVRDGNSNDMGARPVKRLIRERIFETIAIATVQNKIHKGDTVLLDIIDNEVVVVTKSKSSKKLNVKKKKIAVVSAEY